MTAADDVVEDERDDRPGHVVERGRGRDVAHAGEDDGEVDVLDERVRPLERDRVRDARQDRADQEEVYEGVVDLPGRELPLRADDTPDDGRGAEHLGRGTDEAVLLLRVAHSGDVGEHPCLNGELHRSSDDGRGDLGREHRARTRREEAEG